MINKAFKGSINKYVAAFRFCSFALCTGKLKTQLMHALEAQRVSEFTLESRIYHHSSISL